MTDFNNMSEADIQAMIDNAEKALKERQSSKRKEVLAQIRELAASIGVVAEIHEANDRRSERKGSKVAPRYRDPANPHNTWTGRGLAHKWLQALIDSGRDREEFAIK